MNRKQYRAVAKAHGVSVKEVKAGINEAIDHAYKDPTFHARCVYKQGEKPTADELIDHVTRRIKHIKDGKDGE